MKEQMSFKDGISVIICCYNSSNRLEPTLTALSVQRFKDTIDWEVIIIDNASADDTSAEAIRIWDSIPKNTIIDFSVYYEGLPGLVNARKKGIAVSKYQYILFCDDDNWLSPNYLEETYNILSQNSSIAACGGKGIPFFEGKKPYWFDVYAEAFAVGSQDINNENGKLLNLYGAGIGINKNALEGLKNAGFKPQMIGRTGKSLSSSEDTELTYAFVLNGYKLYYSDNMSFQHYLPKERLQFDYLKKLFIAFGTDGPVRNLYYSHISNRFFHKLLPYWSFHLLLSIFRMFKYWVIPPKKYGRAIYLNWNMAYLKQLFYIRSKYKIINNNIIQIKQVQRETETQIIKNHKTAAF